MGPACPAAGCTKPSRHAAPSSPSCRVAGGVAIVALQPTTWYQRSLDFAMPSSSRVPTAVTRVDGRDMEPHGAPHVRQEWDGAAASPDAALLSHAERPRDRRGRRVVGLSLRSLGRDRSAVKEATSSPFFSPSWTLTRASTRLDSRLSRRPQRRREVVSKEAKNAAGTRWMDTPRDHMTHPHPSRRPNGCGILVIDHRSMIRVVCQRVPCLVGTRGKRTQPPTRSLAVEDRRRSADAVGREGLERACHVEMAATSRKGSAQEIKSKRTK
jgi:hypothetical protein